MPYQAAMAIRDLKSERLYVDAPLSEGARVILTADQAHYLLNVLRMAPGQSVLLFNGRDGEWRANLTDAAKKSAIVTVAACERAQEAGPDVHYLFAPLKRTRLDYMVQKATEMGVARLCPVTTDRTIAERVNLDRMRANVVEAAEQCGILRVPEVSQPRALADVLDTWDAGRRLIFCDEAAAAAPLLTLKSLAPGPFAVLIGPEGGFSDRERERLLSMRAVTALSLGPRIMRADTAAVAALALVNATLGDWA